MAFQENLNMDLEGESPSIDTRLQQGMPDVLMRVDGVRESLQADFLVARDRVEQSLDTANSIIILLVIFIQVEFKSL